MLVGRRSRAMWLMTFHSACARILRADGDKLGYTRGFTIYDQADSLRLVKSCIDELDVDPKRFTPRAIQRQISDAKNGLLDAEAYRIKVSSFFEQTAADVYQLYESRAHAANAMDFDDLLFRCVNLFELFPEVRKRYQEAFRFVLVDEYQDTNRAQYRWLQLLDRRAPQPLRRRRRRPGDLRLPRRRRAQHPRLRGRLRGRQGRQARAELPLDADDPQRRQRGDHAQPRAQVEVALERARRRRADSHARARRRARRGPLRRLRDRAARRRGRVARRDRGLLPHQRPESRARGHAGPLRRQLPGDRRHQVLRARRDQGRARLPHAARQPLRRGLLPASRQLAAAGDRQYLAGAAGRLREHDRRADLGRRRRSRTRCPAWARRRSRRSGAS